MTRFYIAGTILNTLRNNFSYIVLSYHLIVVLDSKEWLTMPMQPGLWTRLVWQLTPLGRIRLLLAVLARRDQMPTAKPRLYRALAYLNRPQLTSHPDAITLISLVLEQLIVINLRESCLDEADGHLSHLVALGTSPEITLRYHHELFNAYISTNKVEAADTHGLILVSDPACMQVAVADVLRWALSRPDQHTPIHYAQAVTPSMYQDPLVQTLRLLCLAKAEYSDTTEATTILDQVYPDLLYEWPVLTCRAHLLIATCAEALEQYEAMLAASEAALRLEPFADGPRYWSARALLHLGQYIESKALLNSLPCEETLQWNRLATLVCLCVTPDLAEAPEALRILREVVAEVSPAQIRLALRTLQLSVAISIYDAPERLNTVALLCNQAIEIVGDLPWAHYYLILNELIVECAWDRARERLLGTVVIPAGGCPVALLHAVCAVMIGSMEQLKTVLLPSLEVAPEFVPDLEILRWIITVLYNLQDASEPESLPLDDTQKLVPGPLTQVIPALQEVFIVLQELVHLGTEQTGESKLLPHADDCTWARWLSFRLSLLRCPLNPELTEYAQRLSSDAEVTSLDQLPLLWDSLRYLQEFAGVITPSPVQQISSCIDRLVEKLAFEPVATTWQILVEFRSALLNPAVIITHDTVVFDDMHTLPASCPWWHPDNPLQPLIATEILTEYYYLQGRQALRHHEPEQAFVWFAQSRETYSHATLANLIIKKTFTPILNYWEGVALAHAGRIADASAALNVCVKSNSQKKPEALAQLGLLAIAVGNLTGAEQYLSEVPTPLHPAACYLSGLLAEKHGNLPEVLEQLTPLTANITPINGIYNVAAHRLLGALAERTGQNSNADAHYQRALSCWPNDLATAARLARNDLYQRYVALSENLEPSSEINLEKLWPFINKVDWAHSLAPLHIWLKIITQDTCDADLTLTMQWDDCSLTNDNYRRIALKALLKMERVTEAIDWLEHWSVEPLIDPILSCITRLLPQFPLLRAAWEGQIDEADKVVLIELNEHLSVLCEHHTDEAILRFWQQVTQLASNSEDLEIISHNMITTDIDVCSRHAVMCAAIGLFSEKFEARQAAAELWMKLNLLETHTENPIITFLSAIAAYVFGDDTNFLTHYSVLECSWPKVLPCSEEALFLAAGRARLRVDELAPLTDNNGFIPPSLTALELPEVREIFGLAYARSVARNPVQNVAHLQQSLDFLFNLQQEPEA